MKFNGIKSAGLALKQSKRIVIKVGSALIFDQHTKMACNDWLISLAQDIAFLHSNGAEVIIVSSGAIVLGRQTLGLLDKKMSMSEKQAASSVGQVALMNLWSDVCQSVNIQVSQVLLAPRDTEERKRHINLRQTMSTLLSLGVVPIVNENDSVTTYEICFGDNDRLAARVATMMSADMLVLLSDINGLYDRNPKQFTDARHIPYVDEIDEKILSMGGDSDTDFASGGMKTKLSAAQMAMRSGTSMVICSGQVNYPIRKVFEGAQSTLFQASITPEKGRKKWIAGSLSPSGGVLIDHGAFQAICSGKSLLHVGALEIRGSFDRGDLVEIIQQEGVLLGYGVVEFHSSEAKKLLGVKSEGIFQALGYEAREELIHVDNLVITANQ